MKKWTQQYIRRFWEKRNLRKKWGRYFTGYRLSN